MSIKTSKRIALGVIASLVFAPFAAIAPANAAIASASTFTLSNYTIVAGEAGVVASIGGTGAEHAIVVTSPAGTESAIGSEIANATLGSSSAVSGIASTVTFGRSAFLIPGTYTLYALMADDGELDAAGEATGGAPGAGLVRTLTVVSPASSTAMAVNVDSSIIAIGGAPTVRAWRPTNGVVGEIKFITDRSADLDVAAGTVNQGADTSSTTGSYDTYTLSQDDVAGTYVITAWVDTNDNDIIDGSEPSASVSFTISSASSATDVITVRSTASVVDDEQSVTICATITDASGRPLTNALTIKLDDDNFDGTFDASTTAQAMTQQGSTNEYCVTTVAETSTLGADYADVTFTVENAAGTASEDIVIRTVETAATTVPNTVGAAIFSLTGGEGIGSVTDGVRQTLTATGGANIGTSTATTGMIQIDRTLTTQTYKLDLDSSEAGEYVKVVVAPKAAQAASIIAPSTSYYQVTADGGVTFSVSTTAPTAGSGYTVTVSGSRTSIAYIQYATATPTVTVTPATNVKAAYGSSTEFTASLTDQFGRPMAAKTLVYTVSGGRNATVTGTLTTATDGSAKYTLTDAVTDTVNLTDTITFTYNYVTSTGAATTASDSGSVTYSATGIVVGSVTLTPASTADVLINQVSGTGASNYVAHTAQVYLSTGLPAGAGVLVTCAGGTDDQFYLGVKTAVTGAAGTAVCNVFRTKAGSTAITATAGGKTSPAASSVTFVNDGGGTSADGTGSTGASDARNVKVSAAQTIIPGSAATVVATVTDRWGNPVEGVLVTWSQSGIGRPVTGADLTVGTDSNGQAQVQVTSLSTETGVATVSASIATANNQTLDAAGFVSGLAVDGVTAGNRSASSTVTFATPPVPEVVIPPVAPTLKSSMLNGRVLLFGSCMADEGDMIIYVKSPGKPWQERAKTLECVAGEYDGSVRMPQNTKYFRVKQEGTGLWSPSVLVRP